MERPLGRPWPFFLSVSFLAWTFNTPHFFFLRVSFSQKLFTFRSGVDHRPCFSNSFIPHFPPPPFPQLFTLYIHLLAKPSLPPPTQIISLFSVREHPFLLRFSVFFPSRTCAPWPDRLGPAGHPNFSQVPALPQSSYPRPREYCSFSDLLKSLAHITTTCMCPL